MDYKVVVVNIILIFALIGVGYIAGKCKLFSAGASKEWSSLLIKVTLPFSIFSSMLRDFEKELMINAGLLFGLGFVFLTFEAVMGQFLAKKLQVGQDKKGIWIYCCMFTNSSFMGFPVANAIWGADGVFLASILNLSFTIMTFTVGIRLVCMGREEAAPTGWKQMIFTNINLSIVLGLLFFMNGWTLPEPMTRLVGYLGGLTTPLSMLVIGLNLAGGKFRELISDRDALTLSLQRLIVAPLVIYGISLLLPLDAYPMVRNILLVIFAMPVPSLCLIFAEQYGGNCKFAMTAIFQTTLFSIVTIPLILLFL